ncbi:hypothetical protein CANARDRAFT_23902 [[Candida] arabinofermentans NRRL YB-2248]|uniref:EF-hand domain-containing protein n=1 Tax=[Candida] arabinofermentans NRRL YB-2248 TaxID=983967 RepID=A0A1E4SYB3_9ASCO|nr:hypothetical protein CANARDRAFT_23902 [[Candida] arabinofermentans NRRL YB-2248]
MNESTLKTYKDAFNLFDKKNNDAIPITNLGDLLRSIGQNPTLSELQQLTSTSNKTTLSFDDFVEVANRENGFKSIGVPEDYIKAFQVFDKNLTGFIGVGELKYILTNVGEKLSDDECEELLKGVSATDDGNVDYVEFVKSILAQ